MPPREWRLRIEDILECIGKIQRYTNNLTYDQFIRNDLIFDAVLRNLSIIGEAAAHLPQEITSRYPDLPWTEMRGMRNIIMHEYFGADIATIWDTVQSDLPPLIEPLARILDEGK